MSDTFAGLKRTAYCGTFRTENSGEEVVVCGFVQRARNLGGLLFVALRDRTGLVQCVFDGAADKALFEKAGTLRSEYVVAVKGEVRRREKGMENTNMATGEIEILGSELRILSEAQTPPFEILENSNVNEELRLKHRYLDLRRPDLNVNFIKRSKAAQIARDYFTKNDFLEIETPMLIKSTPEGARDYLVPSRLQNGKFYALPQSPQIYKQLLMLSGMDRYIQIVRCFRDEDLRADRQPEFTQIDLEMSFINMEDILEINEGFLKRLWKEMLDVDLVTPFLRMPYSEAMERFGSDKPDIRFGYEIENVSAAVKGCGFKVFADTVANGGSVRAIVIDGGAEKLSRKEIDSLGEYVKTYRAKGLAWSKLGEESTSSFAKFLTAEENEALLQAAGAKKGDVVFVVADKDEIVFDALGALRCEVARRLGILDKNEYKFLWVTEFPLFEYDEEENRYVAKHHPFTSPMDEDITLLESNPKAVRAKAYDIVLNGTELGGGSLRIYSNELQEKMFSLLGFTKEQAYARFGFLLEAFKYGVPPHGGLAYGLDRLMMFLCGRDNIRDVIAFPKVQNASELMSGCPDYVDDKQLKELGLTTK